MESILLMALCAVVVLVGSGVYFGKDKPGLGLLFGLIGAAFVGVIIIGSSEYFGTLEKLDGSMFVVKAKVVENAAKTTLLLYDIVNDKNRITELSVYPPADYREVTTGGKTYLVPTNKYQVTTSASGVAIIPTGK